MRTLMIPAITTKAALAGFKALGLDTEAILNQMGISKASLENPFASLPDKAFAQMWMLAFKQMPDPTLPTRAGMAIPFNEFGILDHLVYSAESIGEGLHILNIFLHLVATEMSISFSHGASDWVWIANDTVDNSRHISEQWTLAIIYQRFSDHLPGFNIEEVHLSQAAVVPPSCFETYWNVPVKLGQRYTGFRLSPGVWNLPNQLANPHLKETLHTVASQIEIKQFEDAPLVYAIRTRFPEALARGEFSAEEIAEELGLSKRSLQRKLAEENITFKELLDLYRQEQAMMMLANGEHDMGRIAYDLGYNEQSSFNRAFKRWTGQSPTRWLAEHGSK